MANCVVASCRANSAKRRDLAFFPIPKDRTVRDEWMDVLSLKSRQVTDSTRICEVHFRSKDFSETASGKKVLKYHALPVLKIGRKSNKYIDSDEDFMQCSSDSDPEILEVKKISKLSYGQSKSPSTGGKTKEKIEEETPPEPETGRRPSRRAAQEAAKKIHNTVRSFALSAEAAEESLHNYQQESPPPPRPAATPKPAAKSTPPSRSRRVYSPKKTPAKKFRDQKTWHAIRAPSLAMSLQMECHEELLSAVQAEALMKAQIEYNNCMKKLRDLKAKNVRIICENGDDVNSPVHSNATAVITSKSNSTAVIASKASNIVTLTTGTATQQPTILSVLPIRLVTVQPSSGGGIANATNLKPSSPALIVSSVNN